MSLNETPSANRIHIGFFGKRNAGKSSLVNAITGQDMAVVSDKKGTTTDPVKKAMELLPLGPVVIIDTPGYDDDEAELGSKRVMRAKKVLNYSDIAILVVDGSTGEDEYDRELIGIFKDKNIPFLVVYNKADKADKIPDGAVKVSALTGEGITELKNKIGELAPHESGRRIIGDMLQKNDLVVLVTPIDESAPKGRMILPQMQTIRDVLDADAVSITLKETELEDFLKTGIKPKLVITDSQAFEFVSKVVPEDIPLTSFSILLARYKGYLETAVKGVAALGSLKAGDKVLISEGCTHHRQCNDIGTVKIPRWLKGFSGSEIEIETSSGLGFPEDLSKFKAIIHCGGCMLTEREISYRMKCAEDSGIPFTNYGIMIAYVNGILPRALAIFPELQKLIK